MAQNLKNVDLQFADSDYGLSARRLWEHTELGQLNVFKKAISSRSELNDAAEYVDVVWFGSDEISLTGFTLAELRTGEFPDGTSEIDQQVSPNEADTQSAVRFLREVAEHLDICSIRMGTRNQHSQFLPAAQLDNVFGVPLLFSTLQRRLQDMGTASAGAGQWMRTIENLRKKGLRSEELERSGLGLQLGALEEIGESALGMELSDWCDFSTLKLSVIPVVKDAKQQLIFTSAPERKIARTKALSKPQSCQTRTVVGFDRVLGYRVESVEHQTLWGAESHWQAVTHDGQVILDANRQSLFSTKDAASNLASVHAKKLFPKRLALGRWSHIAWSGGEDYREWLITLPYYWASYFSSHFDLRNVLAHVRCDIRQGGEGERVLLLQEVQSDWAQNVRREIACGDMEPEADDCPPFVKEWPALAMKLMLLHAVNRGLHAVAWTRGAHQAFRYKGLGANGLAELYDKTLPREVNRMMKPFGVACERIGVFVPTNFSIRESEAGYEVFAAANQLLGTARTLEDARELVPDGGHELLYEVHGVRLADKVRESILKTGFPAWG
jgi:hypothetical protein